MTTWKTMDTAPTDGSEVLVFDGFGVCAAAYDADTSFEDFLTICDEDEGEAEWLEYLAENPGNGWVSREPLTGDFIILEPVMWMEMPSPPVGVTPTGVRLSLSDALSPQ